MERKYSFIIPVYNRPQEIRELLESFSKLDFSRDYEIVIIEDGSSLRSDDVVKSFSNSLTIRYFYKENSGPGDSRNYGMQRADGNYFLILDSDCILPSLYLKEVDAFLKSKYVDCFGGPDRAHESFTNLQKAINYSMTSFLTTGGIRGKKKSVQKFEPRSFNMGLSREAFEATEGFGKIHPGEDPDLARRLWEKGFKTAFIENAFVYHKRRISWSQFYKQVRKFGLVRPILSKRFPDSAKISFWFPSLFAIYTVLSIILLLTANWIFPTLLLLYCLVVFADASIKNISIKIGFLSVFAVFIQFFGYGIAFLSSTYYIRLLKKKPEKKFPFLFFK